MACVSLETKTKVNNQVPSMIHLCYNLKQSFVSILVVIMVLMFGVGRIKYPLVLSSS